MPAYRRSHPRRRKPLLIAALVVITVLIGAGSAIELTQRSASTRARVAPRRAVTASTIRSTSRSLDRSFSPSSPSSRVRTGPPAVRPAVLTPGGMWWGVDSSGPITAEAISNVRGWYQGATPQFWGRYLGGDYAVTRAELAYARSQGIYVYLIVNDSNCSQCPGGDICGNDLTPAQARTDALQALHAASAVGVPEGAVLFKDIEQIASCRGEPSAAYLTAWYHTLRNTDYRTGFYGNAYQQNYDFPRGYCAAARDHDFATDVILDMNQPEPRLGVARGTTGPRNAPPFAPTAPSCAPKRATVLWQYGESTDPDNYTDIDQARPDIPGLLTPDGTTT